MHIDEVLLEHCTLSYDLMNLWKDWDFRGDLGLGVIDQRSDVIETVDVVRKRVEPALKHFPRERLILTSECGFGHVPLDITRQKLRVLAETCRELRTGISAKRSGLNRPSRKGRRKGGVPPNRLA